MSKAQNRIEVGTNIYNNTIFVTTFNGASSFSAEMGPADALVLSEHLKSLAKNIQKTQSDEQQEYMSNNMEQ
jgi:hypothetical protein